MRAKREVCGGGRKKRKIVENQKYLFLTFLTFLNFLSLCERSKPKKLPRSVFVLERVLRVVKVLGMYTCLFYYILIILC